MIRIANGQGFWGDWLEAPVRLVDDGPIDFLVLDYLAEITMSILQKQKQEDPKLGYARDFPPLIGRLAHKLKERGIRVVANAGGVNPTACAQAVLKAAPGLKVAVVQGDDVYSRLDEFLAKGYELRDMDTGEPISTIRNQILSANAYIGAFPLAEALDTGADVVIAGRSTDTALTLGPMVHTFGWKPDDWDKLAAGTIAGHTVECGAQCTGGNCQVDWETIPNMADIGYPIIEAEPDGTFSITKHAGTGGRVTVASVKEQLLYEMGDPRQYITPDCIADFTTIHLDQAGPDRVRFTGIRGRPATEFYKVSISYSAGFKAIGNLVYAWPDAYKKARAADKILRQRLDRLGLHFDEVRSEFVGANACHGIPTAEPSPEIEPHLAEVVLRIGVRSQDRVAVDRFTKELAPLVLNGPPAVAGLGSGRPRVEEIVAYWPALIPKREVTPEVTVWPNEN